MHIIIVHGPCGCGKTHMRKELYAHIPYLDMCDLREKAVKDGFDGYAAYNASMHNLFDQLWALDKMNTAEIVVEGIFAPGSDSYGRLLHYAEDLNATYELVLPKYTVEQCRQRIEADYEKDGNVVRKGARLFLLKKYAPMFMVKGACLSKGAA